jgi:lysophospholipase L1-like esterase
MQRFKILASFLALVLLVPAGAALAVDTGSANFTTYVSIGDSLTAGYTSNSLIQTSQKVSYPALIAQQAGVTDFQQPLVTAPGIPGILVLQSIVGFPPLISPSPGLGAPANLTLPRFYNNMAVPGESVHSLLTVTTDNGGLHDLILRQKGLTQLQEALAQHPTFVTLWIGNNDALGAVLAGRVIEGVTLTPPASFQQDFQTVVGAIQATGAKMAIANIPHVPTIPFANTLSRFIVNRQGQVVLIGGSPVPLIGPNGPLRDGDRVLLSASSELAKGNGVPQALGGSGVPLSDAAVLSIEEAKTINDRVDAFNTAIKAAADGAGAAYVDVSALQDTLATQGVEVGGIPFTAAFLTGGAFSYDGFHPTSIGYAFVANAFIAAINDKFGAHIPPVNLARAIFGQSLAKDEIPLAGFGSEIDADQAGGFTPFIFTEEAMRNLAWVFHLPDPASATTTTGGRRHHPH